MDVHESPKEIDDFANALKVFNGDLRSAMSRLKARYGRLSDTWRDPAFARFQAEYLDTIRHLERFLRDSDAQIQPLHRRAEALRQILHMR